MSDRRLPSEREKRQESVRLVAIVSFLQRNDRLSAYDRETHWPSFIVDRRLSIAELRGEQQTTALATSARTSISLRFDADYARVGLAVQSAAATLADDMAPHHGLRC